MLTRPAKLRHCPHLSSGGARNHGSIHGELSFAANSGELERTRKNSAQIRHRFANTDTPPNSGECSPEYAERLARFARVCPYSAANWRTVRQKIRSREEITSTSNKRSLRTSLSRTGFAANVKFGERVRQKFLGNGPLAN